MALVSNPYARRISASYMDADKASEYFEQLDEDNSGQGTLDRVRFIQAVENIKREEQGIHQALLNSSRLLAKFREHPQHFLGKMYLRNFLVTDQLHMKVQVGLWHWTNFDDMTKRIIGRACPWYSCVMLFLKINFVFSTIFLNFRWNWRALAALSVLKGMPSPACPDLGLLWQSKHRPALHDPSTWCPSSEDVSLTYCGSGGGFHGQDQLRQFCGLYPAALHSLSPAQLQRFDNRLESLSITIDEGKGRVVEECLLSVFHCGTLDWLAPGVAPCNRQISVPLCFSVQYDKESQTLVSVRVWWDQAFVLKQIGAFSRVISGKPAEADEAFSALPILTPRQLVGRLTAPTAANSNPLHPMNEATRPAAKKTVLEGMRALLTDLPDVPITPARHRKLPALESSIFQATGSAPSAGNKKVHASQASHIVFDDSVGPVKPVGLKLVDRIFAEEQVQAPTSNESIKINPNRLESHVFDDSVLFVPSVVLDPKRLQSHVFDETAPTPSAPHVERRGLDSHIFDAADANVAPPAARNSYNASHFTLAPADDETVQSQHVDPAGRNCASHFSGAGLTVTPEDEATPRSLVGRERLASHFHGASFEPDANTTRDGTAISVATKSTQSFVFKSSITFGDDAEEERPAVAKKNVNQSQVCFDESAPLPPPKPSLKVSQPPGGRSNIIF